MIYKVIPATSENLKKKTFDIRKEVFVIEQQVPESDEFDEFDNESHHFLALHQNETPIGCARWRYTEKGIKLERFSVKKSMREKGLGTAILESVMKDISQKAQVGTYLYMHAQLSAVSFYLKFGFQIKGDQFNECGIMHYLMWQNL